MKFLKEFFKTAGKNISKHSPEILTGVAVAGSIASVIMAVKATPLAIDEISELKKEKKKKALSSKYIEDDDVDIKPMEYVKSCWKLYLPTAATLTTSIVACIGSNMISAKRAGALATGLAITQETLRTYQQKVIEEVGKNKEEKIRSEVAKEQINKNKLDNSKIIIAGNGKVLCLDTFTGRYFRSSVPEIKEAVNDTNFTIVNDNYASLNEFYNKLGLEETEAGDSLGWSTKMDVDISAEIANLEHNQEPCLVISFKDYAPVEGYKNLFK